MSYDILITGVGGQGQVLASRLIGNAAIRAGLSARTGETIGMAQRGGSVVSNVRVGGDVLSPSVPFSHADLIIGFELCETARAIGRLKPGGGVVLNLHTISPVTVSLGLQSYDGDAFLSCIKAAAGRLIPIDAQAIAKNAGSEKCANVVLLGAACGAGLLPFTADELKSAIRSLVPARYLPLNEKAFAAGFQSASESTLEP